ncbi:MAG: hypothetical protein AAGJ40_14080 [Planctomycetota bacterium]
MNRYDALSNHKEVLTDAASIRIVRIVGAAIDRTPGLVDGARRRFTLIIGMMMGAATQIVRIPSIRSGVVLHMSDAAA